MTPESTEINARHRRLARDCQLMYKIIAAADRTPRCLIERYARALRKHADRKI